MELGVWNQLSTSIRRGELDEVSRAIGNKIVDDNQAVWSEFTAILDIFCENDATESKENVLKAVQFELLSCPTNKVVMDFASIEVCII